MFTMRHNDDDREMTDLLMKFESGWLCDLIKEVLRARLNYRVDQQAQRFAKAVRSAVSGEDVDAFIEYALSALGPLGIMGLLNNDEPTIEILIKWRLQEWQKK